MSNWILGVHAGHNSGAMIGQLDSGILYAAQEERFTGEKNYWGFPSKAIKACLAYAGIEASEVEQIVIGSQQNFIRYHSREDVIESYRRQDTLGGKVRQRFLMPMALKLMPKYGQKELLEALQSEGFDGDKISYYDHHTSHAATAYYGLRKDIKEDYLILTCDGSGDDLSASVRVMGPNGKDEVVATTQWNNSLGALYSWTTYRMGFVPLEHEYKLMGMAPYTQEKYAAEVRDVYREFLGLDKTGLSFKRKTMKRVSDSSRDLFQRLDGKRFDAICGGLQMFTEELLAEWAANAVKATGVKKVLAAGGVFMNVKANKVIAELPEVEYFEAFPSCGDETLPFGAYYQYVQQKAGDEAVKGLSHFYLGDGIPEQEAESAIKKFGYAYEKPENMADRVSDLLIEGKPVARAAGGMEYGARALGNRSILADPSNLDVVRVINQMVKKRDFWMPFAPMMAKEYSAENIQNPKALDSPYMMMTFDSKENFKDMIAAVQNADLTCRAQLLTEDQNPDMYAIVEAFRQKTGRSVVLNTSFNLHGYPIARTAEDALFILKNSGLEYLILGPLLVKKNG